MRSDLPYGWGLETASEILVGFEDPGFLQQQKVFFIALLLALWALEQTSKVIICY